MTTPQPLSCFTCGHLYDPDHLLIDGESRCNNLSCECEMFRPRPESGVGETVKESLTVTLDNNSLRDTGACLCDCQGCLTNKHCGDLENGALCPPPQPEEHVVDIDRAIDDLKEVGELLDKYHSPQPKSGVGENFVDSRTPQEIINSPASRLTHTNGPIQPVAGRREEPCGACGGEGEEVIGENYVTRDMAIDAGDRSMEGAFYSYVYAPCSECHGSGMLENPTPQPVAGRGEDGKYRKKPIVVDAFQWFPELPHTVLEDSMGIKYRKWEGGVYEWSEGQMYDLGMRFVKPVKSSIVIDTLEGRHEVSPGDWIITGIKGEKYPCKPDIFEATYEPVQPPASTPQGGGEELERLVEWICFTTGYGMGEDRWKRKGLEEAIARYARLPKSGDGWEKDFDEEFSDGQKMDLSGNPPPTFGGRHFSWKLSKGQREAIKSFIRTLLSTATAAARAERDREWKDKIIIACQDITLAHKGVHIDLEAETLIKLKDALLPPSPDLSAEAQRAKEEATGGDNQKAS